MFATVTLSSQNETSINRFERSVLMYPEITECHAICGTADYLLVVSSATFDDYVKVHREILTRLPGAYKIRSIFTLRQIKAVGRETAREANRSFDF